MQRNPHSYQIATGYRTFYSLSLIYQPITKKRLFFYDKIINELEQVGIGIDKSKWFTNLPEVGNIASAAIFAILDQFWKTHKLMPGEKILLLVPESGRFSYGTVLLSVV